MEIEEATVRERLRFEEIARLAESGQQEDWLHLLVRAWQATYEEWPNAADLNISPGGREFARSLDRGLFHSAVRALIPFGDDVCISTTEGPGVQATCRVWSCARDDDLMFDVTARAGDIVLAMIAAFMRVHIKAEAACPPAPSLSIARSAR